VIEKFVREDAASPRTANNPSRQMDLSDALHSIEQARVLLAACPEGAELALAVMAANTYRLRDEVTYAGKRYRGGRKGSTKPKVSRTRRVDVRNQKIRLEAANLRKTLSDSEKAKHVKRNLQLDLSHDTIRKIIAKS
jgi:hypothetical protein